MKTKLILFFFGITFSLSAHKNNLDSLLTVLDKTISLDEFYIEQKEKRISELKHLLQISNITPEQEYDLNFRLFHEYKNFRIDSARNYAVENIRIADQINHENWKIESRLNLVNVYAVLGLYIDAFQLIDTISVDKMPDWIKESYFEAYKQLYYFYSSEPFHLALYQEFRDSLLRYKDPNSDGYKIVYSEKLIEEKRLDEARDILMEIFLKETEDTHWKAVLAYAIGDTYRKEGNLEKQKEFFAISAIADIKNAIKENLSSRELSSSFYETGEVDRAYKYIRQSMKDALFCNARFRTTEISEIFPIIENAYQQKAKTQKDRLYLLLICVGVLSFILIAIVTYVYVQMKRLSKARKSLYRANLQLNELNTDLKERNNQISLINKELSESNILKEEYLARYMNQSSVYLDKLDNYRRSLNKIASTNKWENVSQALKSTQFMEDELKEFYTNFDTSFLQLFPNFIEDFNQLLLPEEKIIPKAKELLNTELRIYALIRLGITDSTKIAQFLRYPVNTIYTYRTKVRNKAAGERERFETDVMKIGMINQ